MSRGNKTCAQLSATKGATQRAVCRARGEVKRSGAPHVEPHIVNRHIGMWKYYMFTCEGERSLTGHGSRRTCH